MTVTVAPCSTEASDSPSLGSFAGDAYETPVASNKRPRLECCAGLVSTQSSSSANDVSLSPEDGPLFGLTLSQEHCKRKDYLTWQEYFFATALLSSLRSKDPYQPSGACLVDPDNRIVGIGYNGFPSGFPDGELSFQSAETSPWMESREPFVIPAEVNCLLNSVKTARGTTLYCVDFPNHDCAKFIVQSRRVSKVVYGRFPEAPNDSVRVSQVLLQQAGVVVEPCHLSRPVELSFADATSASATGRSEDAPSHLSWDEYFMAIALLTARRSKDPNTQVGACIVSRRRIILACGYNGFTAGCSDDAFPWQRSAPDPKHTKYMYVCHAEVNAILNCHASHSEQEGATLYVTLFPCYQCAQAIVQARIRRVVYLKDPYHDDEKFQASRRIFDMADVEYEAFRPCRSCVTLSSTTS
jgi:dCMP deaminase